MTNLIRRTTTAVTTITGTVTTTIVTARAIITNPITRTATKEVVATEMEKAEVVIKVAAVTEETTIATLAVVLHIRAAEVMTTTIVVHETTDKRAAPTVVETTGISTRAATVEMIVTYHVMVEIEATIEVAVIIITTTTTTETTTDKEATLPMTVQVVNNKIVDLNAVSQAMDIVADTEVVIKVVETMATVVATITTMDTTTTIRPKGMSTEEVTIASLPTAAVITRVIECKDVIRGVVADHQVSNRTRLTRPLMNRKASENYEQNATYD